MLGGDRTLQAFALQESLGIRTFSMTARIQRRHNLEPMEGPSNSSKENITLPVSLSSSPNHPWWDIIHSVPHTRALISFFPDLSQACDPLPAHLLPSTLASLSFKRP